MAVLAQSVDDRILYSRNARDLMHLTISHPDRVPALTSRRTLLAKIDQGREAVESALDAERRREMRANEERLTRYMAAAERWAAEWPELIHRLEGLSLRDAHDIIIEEAERSLPFVPPGGEDGRTS